MKKLFTAIGALLDLRAAELRTGIDLIEAVEANQHFAEARVIAGTASGANGVLALGLEAAKCGLREDELHPIMTAYNATKILRAPDFGSLLECMDWMLDLKREPDTVPTTPTRGNLT
jgi:hypothetical protein